MDFLTTEYVAGQAKLGELRALECSLKHHEQGRDADWVELRDALESERFNLGGGLCAVCVKQNDKCVGCPLNIQPESNDTDEVCCGGSWGKAMYLVSILENYPSNANFKAFQDAEAEVCTYIKGVIAKKKAEQEIDTKTCKDCKHQPTWAKNIPCGICDNHSHWKPKESTPALRHGDYGYDYNGSPCMSLKPFGQQKLVDAGNLFVHSVGGTGSKFITTRIGNIFDDLARNAEDLSEFEMESSIRGNKISIYRAGSRLDFRLIGDTCNNTRSFTLDKATEIAHKILQEVATAKRRQNKK